MDGAPPLKTRVCIIGSGPAAHTAAIYAARAALAPVLFEGRTADGVTPGGQITVTSNIENFPGFPDGILGLELSNRLRQQSLRFGTNIVSEKVAAVDFSSRPFKLLSEHQTLVEADAVIIATGAVTRRLYFPGAGDGEGGFWTMSKGISACAVGDAAATIFRDKPLAVIGGGDSALEAAMYLAKYGSKVYVVHRRGELRATKLLQARAARNEKVEVVWNSEVVEAYGEGVLGGVKVKDLVSGKVWDLKVSGLFFAIGYEPATKFLGGQVELDGDGYIVTAPGTTMTSVPGVFAAGDVQDRKYRQSVTAAGTGQTWLALCLFVWC